MGDSSAGRLLSSKQRAPIILGVMAAAISLLALIGWATANAFFKSVRPDFATFKPNAAVGILLLGIGLALAAAFSEKIRIVPHILSAAAALIGLVTILEHLTGFGGVIDAILFASRLEAEGSLPPGRIPFAAALSLLLLGISLMAARAKRQGTLILVQLFSLAAFFISLLTITEYVYNLRLLERVPILATMAINAAFAFLLLSFGTLLLVGARGLTWVFWGRHSGGFMARRLIPVIVLFPMFVGWIIFLLHQEGYFPDAFALALFAVATIITLSALAWLASASIEKSEVQRLEVEEQLRASHRELTAFKFAMDQAAVVAITDAEGRITYVNDKFTEVSGYSWEEAIGKTHRIVNSGYHPLEFFGEMWETIKAGNIWHGEVCNRAKDRRIIWLDATIVPLLDENGRPEKYIAIRFDISARKRAEEKIRENEERYRALASSAQMVWLADPNGTLKQPAENWTEITGLDIIDAPDEWWLEGVHPDDRQFTLQKWRHSMATKEVFEVENRVRSADGSYCWFYSRGVPVFNTDGTVREWVGMTLAIDKRKKAEAELMRLNDELEKRVADRTVELEAVNKELEAFSYSVSHDLRAPLRAMDGFSHVLMEDCAGKLDKTGIEYLQRIRLASQKMARLIDDLLMLSRISRRELMREHINLSEIAAEMLRERQEAEPERNVDLCIQEGIVSYCDEHLARVALENLLGNAWKFTSKKDRAEIAFGVETQNGFPEVFVRDNGAGFDMAFADKLFGAFQRLHSEGDFPGTGIGLATVKRIINLHGGSVRAIGSPGEGAAFYFTFQQQ